MNEPTSADHGIYIDGPVDVYLVRQLSEQENTKDETAPHSPAVALDQVWTSIY